MKKYCLVLLLLLITLHGVQANGDKKFRKLYQKGKSFYTKIDYAQAIPYFEQAEAAAKGSGRKDSLYTGLLTEMADSYLGLHQAEKAGTYYREALNNADQTNSKSNLTYLKALYGMAKFFYKTQQFTQAEPLYLSALPLFGSLNQQHTIRYFESLSALGNIYLQKGEYSKAETYLTEAANTIKAVKGTDNTEYASTLNNLSVVYSILTDYDKAEKSYNELLKTKEKLSGKRSLDYAASLANRGALYFTMNRDQDAEADLTEALSVYERSSAKGSPAHATTLNNLGVLYKSGKQYGKSRDAFREALAIREMNPGKESAAYATSLHNMGVLYDDAGEHDQALLYLKEAKDLRLKLFGPAHPDYIASLDELGMNSLFLEKYSAAMPFFLESVTANLRFIKQNFPGMSEKEKSGFVNNHGKYFDHFHIYGAYVSGYRGIGQKAVLPLKESPEINAAWYNTRLATKGLILTSVQKTKTRILGSGDTVLIEKFNHWEQLKNNIAQSYTLSLEERKQKNIDLQKLTEQADQIEKELSLRSEQFKKVFDPAPVTWTEIQARLKKGEAAVELIRIPLFEDTIYAALLITPELSAPQAVLLTNGLELEKKYFRYYQNCIRFKILDEVSYSVYWKPIAARLKSLGTFNKVYLSSDGIYNQLNPATLFNPETNKYLGEETELYLLSTTKELIDVPFTSLNKKKAILIGNPDFRLDNSSNAPVNKDQEITRSYKGTFFADLPGTDQEIQSINSTLTAFGWKTQIFSRREAGEEKVKEIRFPSLVHIATHGFFQGFNQRDLTASMLASGVAFAGANAQKEYKSKEDGVLTAFEAMNLPLDSTELVVLSACETGLGEVKTGEGVYGIQRGLRVAGAKTIVMSLWKVDDTATQELMSTFYKEWIATGSKHLAFSKAQMAMKKKYVHPYYWGAFVMVGE